MELLISVFPQLLKGAGVTLNLFALTLIGSIPLGIFFAFLLSSRLKVLHPFIQVYIWLMRGTPLLLQLIFVFYGLPTLGIVFDRFEAAVIAFILNYAAYFAEIFRSGIQSMPQGQYEAADVLGYTKSQTFIKIILPQVIKRVLPPVTNETITLVKDTSLAYALTYAEMFTLAKQIAAAERSFIPLFVAGVFYYVFNYIVAEIMNQLEKKLNYYK